jgi:hypothetical protein
MSFEFFDPGAATSEPQPGSQPNYGMEYFDPGFVQRVRAAFTKGGYGVQYPAGIDPRTGELYDIGAVEQGGGAVPYVPPPAFLPQPTATPTPVPTPTPTPITTQTQPIMEPFPETSFEPFEERQPLPPADETTLPIEGGPFVPPPPPPPVPPIPQPPSIEGYVPTPTSSRPFGPLAGPGDPRPGSVISAGPRQPGNIAGFRPSLPRSFRGLLRSPYAQYAGLARQPLASPQFGRFTPEFSALEEEELLRALMGEASDSPAFMTGMGI